MSSVTFKGTVNGLTIVMNDQEPFDKILADIEKKIVSAKNFFDEGNISVRYRGRKLSWEEQRQVMKLLLDKSGVVINSFGEEKTSAERKHDAVENYNHNNIVEGCCKIFRGTVRSGQTVEYGGDVVIVGDVNPGAKVIASGNIIVAGSLRGMVHAGAKGDRNAYVVAFKLQPMQLRIADIITRSPDSHENTADVPEIAFIKDDLVYIENYLFVHPKD